jgi:hypothetical protein
MLDMRIAALVEQLRGHIEELDSEKVQVSALAPRLAAAVKARTKKRQIYLSRKTSVTVSPSTHAPEYDNFDYSYYVQIDLASGRATDLRLGMEPFPKGTDKTVQLTSTIAVLSGDKNSGYAHLYVHPDAQILHEAIVNQIYSDSEGTRMFDQGELVLIVRGTQKVTIPKYALLDAAAALKAKQ